MCPIQIEYSFEVDLEFVFFLYQVFTCLLRGKSFVRSNLYSDHNDSAYYLQCCGYRSRGVDSNGHDLRHGPEFAALLQTIRKHFLPGENDLWRGEKQSLLQPRMGSRSPIHEAGSSDCYCLSQAPAKPVVAERWRMAALALTLSREAVRKTEE